MSNVIFSYGGNYLSYTNELGVQYGSVSLVTNLAYMMCFALLAKFLTTCSSALVSAALELMPYNSWGIVLTIVCKF